MCKGWEAASGNNLFETQVDWLGGAFRDCNGVSNGQGLPDDVIKLEVLSMLSMLFLFILLFFQCYSISFYVFLGCLCFHRLGQSWHRTCRTHCDWRKRSSGWFWWRRRRWWICPSLGTTRQESRHSRHWSCPGWRWQRWGWGRWWPGWCWRRWWKRRKRRQWRLERR